MIKYMLGELDDALKRVVPYYYMSCDQRASNRMLALRAAPVEFFLRPKEYDEDCQDIIRTALIDLETLGRLDPE